LFSLPYIAILFCIFTAWTWGGVITGGACAAGGSRLAPIGFTVGAAGLGASGTLAAGAISGAAGFIYADDDC
jgi:hypothetical protein